MERNNQVAAILSFVDDNRESHASRIVCAKVLGEKDRRIDNQLMGELHARLPRARQDVIDDCYTIIS